MQPFRKDILGKQNPDRRIGVILAHTKKPDGLAVVDLLYDLGLKPKDRSGLQTNHLDKLIELGILEKCSVIPEHGKQQKKRDGHRLKTDIVTFSELFTALSATEHIKTFLQSPYTQNLDPVSEEITRALLDVFRDYLKNIEFVIEYVLARPMGMGFLDDQT